MLILVVGKLTRTEQKIITRINRVYDEINFFIELKGQLELHKKLPISETEI